MASWSKPGYGFLKLNAASVFDEQARKTAVGCVVRDSMGVFKKGAAGMIGLAPPVVSELWALFYGLKLAWEMDIGTAKRRFVVETHSVAVVHAVLHPDPSFPFAPLVDLINALLREQWDALELTLIAEEANTAAITLARHNLESAGGVDEFEAAPNIIQPILNNEA